MIYTYFKTLALQPMLQPEKRDLRVSIGYRHILRIALPISGAIIVPQINFITNNIFLGGLNQQALAAAGITGVYYLVFAVVGIGLNNGMQALIARRAGENRIDEIGSLFAQGVVIALIFALIGMLITWIFAPFFLKWALHDLEIIHLSIRFLNIRIVGLVFLYLYQLRNALLVGTNQSKFLIWGALAETIANILFDYGLIFGKYGLPRLEFNGAAYASVIAEFTGLIVIFFVIHLKGISNEFELFKHFKFSKSKTKLILVQSAPLIGQFGISIFSWQIFYILIEHHGARDLAISNIMRSVFGIFGCFTWAFAATTSTMVSNIIGQGMQDKVTILIKKIIHLSFAFSLMACLLLNIFPTIFLSIYRQGIDFNNAAIPVLRIITTALLIMSVSVVWLNAVTGTGNTRINLLIEILAILFYLIYVYIILEKLNLPITYGWLSEWIYWGTILIPSYCYIRSGRWKNKVI